MTAELTMDEARQIAAQAWCEPETSGIEMDVRLAEAFARRLVARSRREATAPRDEAPNDALREALRDCANLAERNGQVQQCARYTHPIIERARALAGPRSEAGRETPEPRSPMGRDGWTAEDDAAEDAWFRKPIPPGGCPVCKGSGNRPLRADAGNIVGSIFCGPCKGTGRAPSPSSPAAHHDAPGERTP